MTRTPDQSVAEVRQARGAALKQARRGSGLSARKLVERVNARTAGSDITEHAIYAYESGRVQLSREVAERVAEVLKVSLGGLLVGDPDFEAAPAPAPPPAPASAPAQTPPAPAYPAYPPAPARERERPVVASDGPPEHGRWAATRSSLLERSAEAEPAAAVLVRQLSARRFQLPDPIIFAASFELLDADLSALLASPEAAWVKFHEPDRWHEPLLELLAGAEAVREAALKAWGDLRASAAGGRAADACPAAVKEIESALGDFRDAIGRVKRLVAAA